MLRLLGHFVLALLVTAGRRVGGRRIRPRWSFGFEVLVEGLRRHTAWLVSLPIPAMRSAAASLSVPLPPGITQRRETIAGVPVTWFEAPGAGDRVVLYAHGGGHVFGSAAQDRGMASELARLAGAKVVAPDYRLAPEDPCPADVDDLVAVYETLATQPPGPPLAIVGLSAGGGAALAALMRLRDAGKPLPKRAVLLSPMVDAEGTSPSWSSNAGVDWPAPAAGRRFGALYAGKRPLADPEVSPVNGRLEGLPPMLVIVGDAELLRDDAFALAERARAAGVGFGLHVEPDMVHAFMTLGRKGPSIERAFAHIRAFLTFSIPG
jgi:acetyl esterase/lipase